jgi:ferredoxin
MKVLVESPKCSGHGMCFATASHVFDLDDEGFALIQDSEIEVGPDLAAEARTGAMSCPEQAIRITEE